jgi:glycosyltransferase involved in cell wall biosynthesis
MQQAVEHHGTRGPAEKHKSGRGQSNSGFFGLCFRNRFHSVKKPWRPRPWAFPDARSFRVLDCVRGEDADGINAKIVQFSIRRFDSFSLTWLSEHGLYHFHRRALPKFRVARSDYHRRVIAALDATPLVEPVGGIARYTSELSCALASAFRDDAWFLISDQPIAPPAGAPPNLHVPAARRTQVARRWWLFGARAELQRLRADVFHGTDFAVPYLPVCPSVMTVHDLSPWLPPPIGAASSRVRRRTPVLLRLGLATMAITPSEAVRRGVIERFRLPPDRVVATPLAASACFQPTPADPPPHPYFLFAGMLDARKNVETIIAAWREVKKNRDVDLILAGRRRTAAVPDEAGLTVREDVSDTDLARLYTNASAFLFPSHYEGFGLPVLEAMQCGAPVIASRDPAVMEVAGDAATLLDASDVRAWSETMKAALANEPWRASMRERGLARAQSFSWERTARLTREVYAEAIARFRREA